MNPTLSRRAFLRLVALAGIGAGLAVAEYAARPVGTATYVRWLARGQRRAVLDPPAVVALAHCPSYQDVQECLRDLWSQADMPDVRGRRVLVKPNLVDIVEEYPSTTAPQVVAAVMDLLAERGAAAIVVGDGPAFRREAWPLVEQSGLAEVLARRGVPFVDLNYDAPRPVPVRDGWLRQAPVLWLPRHVQEADLIVSVPKLKTHHWAGISVSLKNLFGVVPGARYGWPKNILHINGVTPSILGLRQTLPPTVAVVDGIVGMEGDGPLFGTPVEHGLLAVGKDLLAVDVTCARLMGVRPREVEHLAWGLWAGVGQGARVELRGTPPDALQRSYAPPPKA